MDSAILKEFVLMELQKDIPPEIAEDKKKANEFMVSNINEPLVDKLIAEFCGKNPQEFAVLNVFELSDEEANEIKKNSAVAIADGTIERLKYEQVINTAGLAYQVAIARELMNSFPDAEEELDLLEKEIENLK